MDGHSESNKVGRPHAAEPPVPSRSVGTLDETDLIRTVEVLVAALLDSFGVINGSHCDHCAAVQEQNLSALQLAGF